MISPGRYSLFVVIVLCVLLVFIPHDDTLSWGQRLMGPKNLEQPIQNDLLIVYAYHESDAALKSGRFFLKHGLHAHADFIFVVNGPSQFEREIPKNLTNVEVRLRDNICYDLGTYGQILGENERALVKKYKRFILLNSSIRGPFLPTWSKDCWSDIYSDMITDVVKLGGMTFNCFRQHIQSMIFSTDQIGLGILLDHCFANCFTNMADAIQCEIASTKDIVDGGYKGDVLMTAWRGEYGDTDAYFASCDQHTSNTDVNHNGAYFGFNLHPYETLFVKSNRNVDPIMISKLEEWHDNMKYSSWDVCKQRERPVAAVSET